MLIDLALLLAGFAILYYGAEWLVKGATNVSSILGVSPVLTGLTIVAFGTSLPELVVCLVAVVRGSNDIALGNVIGSNIANIGLVLAAGALLFSIVIPKRTLRRDLPLMLLFSIAVLAMGFDGELSRPDGFILACGLIAFTVYCVRAASRDAAASREVARETEELIEKGKSLSYELLLTALGIAGVLFGAYLLVESAIAVARALNISELVIGMTVVAVGTSLPELATTIVAAYRKQSDIAVGNIIGSNIFNIGFVLGVTSLFRPVHIADKTITGELLVMIAFSLVVIPFAARHKMGRAGGGAILACYFIFILWQAGLF